MKNLKKEWTILLASLNSDFQVPSNREDSTHLFERCLKAIEDLEKHDLPIPSEMPLEQIKSTLKLLGSESYSLEAVQFLYEKVLYEEDTSKMLQSLDIVLNFLGYLPGKFHDFKLDLLPNALNMISKKFGKAYAKSLQLCFWGH